MKRLQVGPSVPARPALGEDSLGRVWFSLGQLSQRRKTAGSVGTMRTLNLLQLPSSLSGKLLPFFNVSLTLTEKKRRQAILYISVCSPVVLCSSTGALLQRSILYSHCTLAHTYACMRSQVQAHTHMCTHAHRHRHSTHTHDICACRHTHSHTHVHAHTHMCTHICTHVHLDTYPYTYMHTRTQVLTHTYVYTHTH